MLDEKVIFEKESYEGGRYRVERGSYRGEWGVRWEYVGYFQKKSSAIAEAESLIAKRKCDRVRVIDTQKE